MPTPPPPPNPRYHRQAILPGFGNQAQQRLRDARALVVGCGALGCVVADHLARAGVGTLTIIDRDVVERTNLQRQTLFDESQVGLPKAEAAAARLAQINSEIRIAAHAADLSPANAESFVSPPPALIIDATDNFETRLLLNDLAVKHAIPFIYAGVVATRATSLTIIPTDGPCLRCIMESPPPGSTPTCDTAGVLAPSVGVIASIQAAEALKVLAGNHAALRRSLIEIDLWSNAFREMDLASARDSSCPCCVRRDFIHLRGHAAASTTRLCGRDAVQITPNGSDAHDLDLRALAQRLAPHGLFELTPFALRGSLTHEHNDAGEPLHLTVFRDGRTIVRGTTRADRARAVCAKYLG